ncbi:hypothetical protein GQX74_007068 [Glossina fuscipes]|nr:hypothetical protein GQX74_007068 [Glossina fuscipes]
MNNMCNGSLSYLLNVESRHSMKSKSPIIVGGTNYYIEALLWDILISNPTDGGPHMKINSDSSEENAAMSDNNANTTTSENSENWLFITESEMLTMSSELLYNHLKKIDPVTAQRIHPNNKRKIMRNVGVIGRCLCALIPKHFTTYRHFSPHRSQ